MKKHEKVENHPLMYIVQPPNLSPISSNMQQTIFIPREAIHHEQENAILVEKESIENINKPETFIPFHEMKTEDKIEFLLNLPSHFQSIKCEITSKDIVYIGQLIERQNDIVSVKQASDPNEIISLHVDTIEKISIINMHE